MFQKKIILTVAIGLLITFSLTSCGGSSEGQRDNQTQSTRWSSNSVLDQIIDLSILKDWGYYNDADSDDLKVIDLKSKDQGDTPRKLLSAKPEKCLPLAIFVEQSSKTLADYLLIQNVSDSSLLPEKSMIFNLYTFSSPDLAQKQFASMKKVAGDCGLYVAQFADENIDRDLWSQAEIQGDYIRAFNPDYDEANSIHLIEDVIYVLTFADYENLSGAKKTLRLAEEIITAKISQKS
jgi:hypothetical protein